MAEYANRVASVLRDMDVRVGGCVAILCLDTAEWVAAFFGTLIGHDAVLECAVVGGLDDAGLIKPKACVVASPGLEPTEETAETLVRHCMDLLSAYKQPRWIEFVEELPKTATGKIQRFRLR